MCDCDHLYEDGFPVAVRIGIEDGFVIWQELGGDDQQPEDLGPDGPDDEGARDPGEERWMNSPERLAGLDALAPADPDDEPEPDWDALELASREPSVFGV